MARSEIGLDHPRIIGNLGIIAFGKNFDMYLVEVKTRPSRRVPWDYYKFLATIPAEQPFRPLDQDQCPLLK
jgi:hypothetical protein